MLLEGIVKLLNEWVEIKESICIKVQFATVS